MTADAPSLLATAPSLSSAFKLKYPSSLSEKYSTCNLHEDAKRDLQGDRASLSAKDEATSVCSTVEFSKKKMHDIYGKGSK